ncbi:tol-pal system protein YbgF [Rivibacter subsaxonicus]|uniref:Cell division coordinator CpoB n=1 Tax=Rivibacter subsaxonicus TaxID=457575 RepID=A0A4Q7W1L8_9BURK|nr:tol-pal system protein YbgF [Rivibacter subsaxonicus]RZU03040.1 tol-pal system protein YbgF [Rivibacter subsaxonicus]
MRPLAAVVRAVAAAAALAALVGPASAGLFDDDEARRAILDLRARIDQSQKASETRDADLAEQLRQTRAGVLELNNLIEKLRTELAQLRGSNEQLQREVAELQRRQKDVQTGIDERLRSFEPQKVAVDGREFSATPDETRLYNDALGLLRGGDFAGAGAAFAAFQKRFPNSGYAPSVHYWLGNAQYGKREYQAAIASFRSLLAAAPDHLRAPEAQLAIANCQIELKDAKSARRTLEELQKTYPKSEAAQAARERLASLK